MQSKEGTGPAAPETGTTHSNGRWAAFWLIAFLLLLSQGGTPGETVRLLDSREPTLWGGAGWQVPLSWTSAVDPFVEVPFLIFAIGGAALVTALAWSQQSLFPIPMLLLGTAALALGMSPEFTLAAGVFLGVNVAVAKLSHPGQRLGVLFAGIFAAILCTQEFGLIIVGLLFGPGADVLRSLKRKQAAAAVVLLLLALTGFSFMTGFFETGARFLTSGITPHAESLIPSTRSVIALERLTAGEWFLLALLAMVVVHAVRSSDRLMPTAALVPIALFCSHYLWLVAFLLCANFQKRTAWPESPRVDRLAIAAGVILAAFQAVPQFPGILGFVLGDAPEHRLDVAAWESRGHVLLMNLDDANEWQLSRMQKRYDLVLDDRWERGDRFEDYAALCRDLNEGRAGSYLRSDLGWGGYAAPLDRIEPTLLVQSSDNLIEIRRLSLSPHWRILGIDAERTYFGYTDDRTIQPQGRRAIELLNQLEWPRGKAESLPANTIVADSWEDSLKVSAVICAIRFPYAAMRYLADDTSLETLKQRSWCWVEIAHRVRRHAGTTSLLDQSRAIAGFRRAMAEGAASAEELLDMAISLHVLEAPEAAIEFAEASLREGALTLERRAEAEAFIVKATAAGDSQASSVREPEKLLRLHLKRGNRELATELYSQLPADRQPFYSFLIGVPDRSTVELYHELSGLIDAGRIPGDLLDEARFYQGCLGLEAGDTFAAVTAFQASREVAPESRFAPLREMYLLRLGR